MVDHRPAGTKATSGLMLMALELIKRSAEYASTRLGFQGEALSVVDSTFMQTG